MEQVTQLKRRRVATLAKTRGDWFESCIEVQGRLESVEVVKIPQGAQWFRRHDRQMDLKPVKTPFDFFAVFSGKAVFFDAKTTDDTNFTYSTINQLQVSSLLRIERKGCRAGYLIHYRITDEIWFVPASALAEVKPRGSINLSANAIFVGRRGEWMLRALFL